MTDSARQESAPDAPRITPAGPEGWLSTGGLLGAILASSCCIVPLALAVLGISGAWIGSLTALAPYKPYFIGAAVLFLAGGFWQAYGRRRTACAVGSSCARPASGRMSRIALWVATGLVVLSATINFWAPLFY